VCGPASAGRLKPALTPLSAYHRHTVKTPCGASLAAYMMLAIASGVVVYRKSHEPAAIAAGAAIGGAIAWMSFAYFVGIGKKYAKARMIRRALDGDAPRDGEKIAAVGRLTAPRTLLSPLSRSECVAYKYEVNSSIGDDNITYYEGFAMTPGTIQGRNRTVRLLVWPDIELRWTYVDTAIGHANFDPYVREAQFREPVALNFRKSFSDMQAIYKDDDGSVRWDQRGPWPAQNLETATYREKLLRPSDVVCVIGHYSAARGGIVPAPSPFLDPVILEVGSEESSFVSKAVAGTTAYFIGGVIFAAIYAGGVIALDLLH